MHKILIVKNISREGSGLLGQILQNNGVNFDLVDLSKDEEFPGLSNYSALIVLGGPDSANGETQKMKTEIKKIKEALDKKIPFLGICLGLQTLVKARGGEIIKNEVKEVGFKDQEGNFFEVSLTEEGNNDPLLTGLGPKLRIFQLHGETVRPTSEMKLLATGKYCENQIIKIDDNAYGIQGHFELTHSLLESWLEEDDDLKNLEKEKILADYKVLESELKSNAEKILTNFLDIAKIGGIIQNERV